MPATLIYLKLDQNGATIGRAHSDRSVHLFDDNVVQRSVGVS